MYIFFADDSTQSHPSRAGMGALVATGGLFISCDQIASLERNLASICRNCGLPPREEFKWSPRAGSWMRANLIGHNRQDFFLSVVRTCADHSAVATVLISDSTSNVPRQYASHSDFVTTMLIERVNWLARSRGASAIIVADRPGGGREQAFLNQCLQTLQSG